MAPRDAKPGPADEDEVWPDSLTTLDRPAPVASVPWSRHEVDFDVTVDLSSEPDRDPDDPRWCHVDAAHPAPWLGCIRRGLCCRTNPGWFVPGQAEKAAALLDLGMAELVGRYLVVDHADTTAGRIEVYAPAKLGKDGLPVEPPGQRTSDLYRHSSGVCVFYDGAGCAIYSARPLECQRYVCTNLPEESATRLEIALLWLEAAEAGDAEG